MDFADVEKAISFYGKKAKDGQLALEDMTGIYVYMYILLYVFIHILVYIQMFICVYISVSVYV
jgi:hypothetical protein